MAEHAGSAVTVELARTVRSGVVEAHHDGSAIAVDAEGEVLASFGDGTDHVFYRSAIKAFQATVSQRNGAALAPEQMALACASHGAHPVQLALVRSMLLDAGLDESNLRCPASRPTSPTAELALARAGAPGRRRIYHNCSGKHGGFLRACVESGWPTATYLDPEHPIQKQVMEMVGDVTGVPTDPVGVDGCGAPAPAGTVTGLARAFARLSVDRDLAESAAAMSAYPALTSDNLRPDGRLAAWWTGPLKRGAQGIIGAGRAGIGLAVKSRSGSSTIAVVGLIALMRRLDLLADAALAALEDLAAPVVYGGGRPVGNIVPVVGG